jgi:hypothetical protein
MILVDAQAWGDLYGKGVRCVTCGKELSNLYLEASQTLGTDFYSVPYVYSLLFQHFLEWLNKITSLTLMVVQDMVVGRIHGFTKLSKDIEKMNFLTNSRLPQS